MPMGVAYSPDRVKAIKAQIISLMVDGHDPAHPEGKGMFFSYAVMQTPVNLSTAYDWRKTDPEWSEAIDKARQTHIEGVLDKAESTLLKNIANGDNTSTLFFLKTQGKSRGYIEKQVIEQTITHQAPDLMEVARRLAFAMNAAESQGLTIEHEPAAVLASMGVEGKPLNPKGNKKLAFHRKKSNTKPSKQKPKQLIKQPVSEANTVTD